MPSDQDLSVQPVRPVRPVRAVPKRFVSKSVSTKRPHLAVSALGSSAPNMLLEHLHYFRYHGGMVVTEVPYSSFLRGPSEVLPALEHGDVQLDRRDAEALVMTRARRYRAAMRGTSLASAMVRDLAKNDAALAARLLAEQLPWLAWMPRAEQEGLLVGHLDPAGSRGRDGYLRTFRPFPRRVGAHR